MTVSVLWPFLMVLRVGLQCVIVVLPDHTQLLFWKSGQQVAPFDEEIRGGSCLNLLNIQYVWYRYQSICSSLAAKDTLHTRLFMICIYGKFKSDAMLKSTK